MKTIIKKTYNPPPNVTKEERKAMTELKKDSTRMILTADIGVSLVVMDKEEYKKKAEGLLQQPTYKSIPTDPTIRYKNKLINLLKSIKADGRINEAVYKRLYPTEAGCPKFYGLPKIHKEGMPLRCIVSQYRGSHLGNIQRISWDPQIPGRKITISSPESPGLHSTNTRHQTTI